MEGILSTEFTVPLHQIMILLAMMTIALLFGYLHRLAMKDSLEYLTNHEGSVRNKVVSANLDGPKHTYMRSMA